jgi:hypothetical protein
MGWENKVESGTLVGPTLGPDPAAVSCNDALDNGEAASGSWKLLGGMQTLEQVEQLADISHIETGAIVPHEIRRRTLNLARADLDDCRL